MDAADLPIYTKLFAIHIDRDRKIRIDEGFLDGIEANLSLQSIPSRWT